MTAKTNTEFVSGVAVGVRLRACRFALGLTIVELAKSLDLGTVRWSQFERAERLPSPDCVARLRRRYGVTMDYVYLGDPSGLPSHLAEPILSHANSINQKRDTRTGALPKKPD
jgi:transcriptional regulator with XRE-family HTH domain